MDNKYLNIFWKQKTKEILCVIFYINCIFLNNAVLVTGMKLVRKQIIFLECVIM